MNPLKEGLIKYHKYDFPNSHAVIGGSMEYVPTGNTTVYSNSSIYRSAKPRGRPRKQQNPEGGNIKQDLEKVVTKVQPYVKKIKPYAKKALDVAAPFAIDTAFNLAENAIQPIALEVAGPAGVVGTKIAKSVARSQVKKLTGYGKPPTRPVIRRNRKALETKDIGIYDGGAYINVDIIRMLSQLFSDVDVSATMTAIKNVIKEPLIEFLKSYVDKLLEIGIPAVAKLLTEHFRSPALGRAFEAIVREFLKSKMGGSIAPKKLTSASDKRKKRGELIKKLMKEKKLSLGEASSYIKKNNLI